VRYEELLALAELADINQPPIDGWAKLLADTLGEEFLDNYGLTEDSPELAMDLDSFAGGFIEGALQIWGRLQQ